MSDEYVENLKKPSAWLRVLFMAGFVLALYVAGVILLVLMLAQILFSLITGEDNANLRRLGASLTLYVSQILEFLTYNREDKPFPFAQFPLSNEDEVDDVTTADSAAAQPESPAPAAGSETAAESAAQVMAESAARRATRSTSKTPKANAGADKTTAKKSSGKKTATPGAPGEKTSAAAGPAADAGSAAGPEMGVTDVVDRQAKDV